MVNLNQPEPNLGSQTLSPNAFGLLCLLMLDSAAQSDATVAVQLVCLKTPQLPACPTVLLRLAS